MSSPVTLSLPTHDGIITCNLRMAGQIFMKFGMDFMPLEAIPNLYFLILKKI
jgi:hypothetical protein